MFFKFDEAPHLDDLINLVKGVENVNQQLLIENRFLREQCEQQRATLFKLIEENGILHKELKNTTVHEILAEFQSNEQKQSSNDQSPDNKTKEYFITSFVFSICLFILIS